MAAVDGADRQDRQPGRRLRRKAQLQARAGRTAQPRRLSSQILHAFSQVDLPGSPFVPAGRYVATPTDDGTERVLVLTALEGTAKRRRRRARRAEGTAPAPVPVTRATLTLGVELTDRAQAEEWLRSTARDRKARAEARRELYGALELAALAWALASMEAAPGIPSPALVERVGFGNGEAVADGAWEEAVELPGPEPGGRPRRPTAPSGMPPILAGREAIEPSALLALRARGDLARGRNRAAAVGIEAALRSLPDGAASGIDEKVRRVVAEAAEQAAREEPTPEQVTALRAAIESLRPSG